MSARAASNAAVQIYGGKNGLRGVRQNGRPLPASAGLLALAQLQIGSPSSRLWATSCRLSSQTSAARMRVKSPSGRSGCLRNR